MISFKARFVCHVTSVRASAGARCGVIWSFSHRKTADRTADRVSSENLMKAIVPSEMDKSKCGVTRAPYSFRGRRDQNGISFERLCSRRRAKNRERECSLCVDSDVGKTQADAQLRAIRLRCDGKCETKTAVELNICTAFGSLINSNANAIRRLSSLAQQPQSITANWICRNGISAPASPG